MFENKEFFENKCKRIELKSEIQLILLYHKLQ